jgi:hypothetical protein
VKDCMRVSRNRGDPCAYSRIPDRRHSQSKVVKGPGTYRLRARETLARNRSDSGQGSRPPVSGCSGPLFENKDPAVASLEGRVPGNRKRPADLPHKLPEIVTSWCGNAHTLAIWEPSPKQVEEEGRRGCLVCIQRLPPRTRKWHSSHLMARRRSFPSPPLRATMTP